MAAPKSPSASVLPLPVLPAGPGGSLRISLTDVSQFIRLEQCHRFLRFRLAQGVGQRFMESYDVTMQRITPLLTRSGRQFEQEVEQAVGKKLPFIAYAAKEGGYGNRSDNNADVADVARRLKPGQVVVLSQPRLQVELEGWLIRGDVDLLHLERYADGALHALIAASNSEYPEYRSGTMPHSPEPAAVLSARPGGGAASSRGGEHVGLLVRTVAP